ncbi:MAG TPA: tetratricopeptide repeat protein, partial [Novosphingobium sp.]|nr:tetratricopeptide repeat protein [Novosphingobium sp.]
MRTPSLSLLAGIAFMGLSAPLAADVKGGVDAWTRGDYPAAVRAWQGPAAQGDADALFNLGQAYKLGRGVRQDLTRAEDLFRRASEAGHLQASDNYGLLLFQRGERARAIPYITAASDRGDPRAQYLLGIAHFNGDIVAKDWVRAYALASLAQRAGLDQASSALRQMDEHIPIEQRREGVALAGELGE